MALAELAAELRADDSVISPCVRDPREEPALGALVAAGPRARDAAGEYALLTEAIREGYLLHYGRARLIETDDADLGLLAGDYLYALGLRRVATLGDLAAVRELADLISLAAQLHGDGDGEAQKPCADALWLSTAVAIATGASDAHEVAKQTLRGGSEEAAAMLWGAASEAAREPTSSGDGELATLLADAAESIGFAAPTPS